MDMSKLDIFILMAVAEGELHGYAAIQAVRERSEGTVRVGTGSFYRRLSLLMKNGLVEEAPGPRHDDPRRGAYYRVTARGRQVLGRERERLAALVAALDGLRSSPRRGRA
jgi:DNA-binding PadR family transcriptional regulator